MNGPEKMRICKRIRELIQSPVTKVYCMFTEEDSLSRKRYEEESFLTETNYTVQTFFEPVQAFHLYFWFFLFLVLVLLGAIYMLVGIEVDQSIESTSSYVQKNPRHEL